VRPAAIEQRFSVRYILEVVERGRVVRRFPARKNLIMDGGLDAYASNSFANLFSQAIVGTGTNPVVRYSNPITVTQAGSTIVSSGSFFTSADVGRILKYGDVGSGTSGAEQYITAYTNATTVTVSSSTTITTPTYCAIWYVNQTGLQAKVKATSTYQTTGNGTVQTVASNILTIAYTRIFIFSAETGTITYNEIGWSWNGTNIFGRDLILPSGVTLVSGQQLQVTLEVSLMVSPASVQSVADVSGGTWNTAGTAVIEYTNINATSGAFSFVQSPAGASTAVGILEPDGPWSMALIIASWTQRTATDVGNSPGTTTCNQLALSPASYTNGSFTRSGSGTIALSSGTGVTYYGLGMSTGADVNAFMWSLQLTTPNTKDNAHTLSFTFTINWARILSN
jgi:hypothetical protein